MHSHASKMSDGVHICEMCVYVDYNCNIVTIVNLVIKTCKLYFLVESL